jgi:hypothetical protein
MLPAFYYLVIFVASLPRTLSEAKWKGTLHLSVPYSATHPGFLNYNLSSLRPSEGGEEP